MSPRLFSGIVAMALVGSVGAIAIGGAQAPSPAVDPRQGPLLTRFESAHAFERYLESLPQPEVFNATEDMAVYDMAPPAIDAPAHAAEGEPPNPEITNNQTIGVDEGGIVKQVGRFLVVLQDGRLFSADIGEGAGTPLRLADRLDVYRSPANAADWYDEMLVHGDRILVTAYNYRERASEITVVRIDDGGRMRREGRYLLSSSDYYSTENYATRLVGDNLVFYAPLSLESRGPDGGFQWPRLRRADGDGEAGPGEDLLRPTDVYQPVGEVEWPVLHTVSVCPLRDELDCRSTAFIGPPMREFYVSPTDAFLWIGAPDGLPWSIEYRNKRRQACPGEEYYPGAGGEAILYRLPLDGGSIGAIAVEGIPSDQFAFDSRDGRFRALLQRSPAGCAGAEAARSLALLDLPLSDFDTRVRRTSDRAYAALPAVEGDQLENRFIGDWLVYAGRVGWSGLPDEGRAAAQTSSLFAVPLARPTGAVRLPLPHTPIRIERAGGDAVVTGYRGMEGLSLSYLSLGSAPRIASTTLLRRRFESEGRSHAFNAWIRSDGSGLIGIPTSLREWRAGRGWSDSESSELSFIAVGADKSLSSAGELAPGPRDGSPGYRCRVSCVDWYGNSRPIFTGGRVFALMGTDLVEGRLANGRIAELARLDLTGPARARGP